MLVNNAGIGAHGPREESADGLELRFAVNYLAGLRAHPRAAGPAAAPRRPARIVNVASAGQQALDFSDLQLEHDYSGVRAYCQSKLAQILFTDRPRRRAGGQRRDRHRAASGHVHADEDGPVADQHARRRASTRRCAWSTRPTVEGVSGVYFNGQSEARADPQAYDADARRALREASDALTARQRSARRAAGRPGRPGARAGRGAGARARARGPRGARAARALADAARRRARRRRPGPAPAALPGGGQRRHARPRAARRRRAAAVPVAVRRRRAGPAPRHRARADPRRPAGAEPRARRRPAAGRRLRAGRRRGGGRAVAGAPATTPMRCCAAPTCSCTPSPTPASGCSAWRRWPAACPSRRSRPGALPDTCGDAAELFAPGERGGRDRPGPGAPRGARRARAGAARRCSPGARRPRRRRWSTAR